MSNVLSFLKIGSILTLGIPFFTGLGWLVIGPLLHGRSWLKDNDRKLIQEIPLAMLGGLLINYGITLIVGSLMASLILGGVLALLGLSCFLLPIFKEPKSKPVEKTGLRWVGAFGFLLVLLIPILVEPISDWDARSFWFFHAKIIYYAGTINSPTVWMHPSVAYTHADYPNLVPALAAQIAYLAGFWNEYLPKASLFFVMVPAFIWLFAHAKKSFSGVFLLLLIPLSFYPRVWDGYMDGFLATYFSIAALFIGMYLQDLKKTYLISAIFCLVILINLKNEGLLAFIAGVTAILLAFLFIRKQWEIKKVLTWNSLFAFLVGLVPFALWSMDKHRWNLTNDLALGSRDSFARLLLRITDGSLLQILQSMLKQLQPSLMILGLLLFVLAIWRIRLNTSAYPALIAGCIYFIGILTIYLMTPADVTWHLATSASRTMYSINGLLFVGCCFILISIEDFFFSQRIQ